MAKLQFRFKTPELVTDFKEYCQFLRRYLKSRIYNSFVRFEVVKDVLVDVLYKKRGKYTRPFMHFGTIGLSFFVITFGPYILANSQDQEQTPQSQSIMTANAFGPSFYTQQAQEVKQYRGGEITTHTVADGETLSTIANRYGLQVSTILWENNITEKTPLRPGMELRILPVDGVRHKVAHGETIYSVGKKYGLEESQVQVIVDYPFNEFSNDETFELATGQYLVIPGGEPQVRVNSSGTSVPSRTGVRNLAQTPDAGAVTASGTYVWPAAGGITQGYSFYHKAIDIANRGAGPILAADSGTVVGSGWDPSGYGNRILIDHGNGAVTLYGHLSALQVSVGQRVNRGDVIGQMGSTGRSTGTHLHFEIRQGGVLLNPMASLR